MAEIIEVGSYKDFIELTDISDQSEALIEYSKRLNNQRLAKAAMLGIDLEALHLTQSNRAH